MRYEGVYHEAEWDSEPKQQELCIVSRLGTERFFMGSSLVTLLKVSCGMWDLKFPDQGLNPGPLNWERGVLSTGPPGKSGFVLV